MRLGFYLFTLSALFSALSLADAKAEAPSRLFFHWGDIAGNRTLLELGGFHEPEHFQDLSKGGQAELTEPVLKQAREWYEKSGKADVAGGGFYMSPDLFNSRDFGHDLLVVEIVGDTPLTEIVKQDHDNKIKRLSDAALSSGDFSGLPPVSEYSKWAKWHVVSRSLTPAERAKFHIVFRPPRAEDVPRIWKEKILGDGNPVGVFKRINEIADEVLRSDAGEKGSATRSADIVFQRMLFDFAPTYILENSDHYPFSQLKTIYRAFEKKLPEDPRTNAVFSKLYRRARELRPGALDLDEDVFKFISESFHRIPKGEQKEAFAWILAGSSDFLKKDQLSYLRIASGAYDVLGPEERLKINQTVKASLGPKLLELGQPLEVRGLLQGIFGQIRGEALFNHAFMERTKELLSRYSANYNRSPRKRPAEKFISSFDASKLLLEQVEILRAMKPNSPSPAYEKLIREFGEAVFRTRSHEQIASTRTSVALSLLDLTLEQSFLKTCRDLVENTVREQDENQRIVTEANYDRFSDPKVITAIRNLVRRAKLPASYLDLEPWETVSRIHQKFPNIYPRLLKVISQAAKPLPSLSYANNPFQVYLEHIVDRKGLRVETFEQEVTKLLTAFPQLGNQIADGILDTERFSYSSLPVPWSRLAKMARQQGANHINWDANAKEVYNKLLNANRVSKSQAPPPPFELFRMRYLHTVLTIPGSLEYSELSRTFNLVEPLFVSEDLRLNAAARPFERFNEHLYADGRHTTQPAWENFTESWNMMASSVWLTESHQFRKQMNWLSGELIRIQKQLVATNVDGAQDPNLYQGIWDRKKYETRISEKEWNDWGFAELRGSLKRFFEIRKTDSGYALVFKDKDELSASAPGVSRYEQTSIEYRILSFIQHDSGRIRDPIQRASRILYLTTRLHPFENGNGRFGRLWASAELLRSGYAMPMGFPTNEYAMSQRQIELEIKKSLKLGEFWEKMLQDAEKRGIKPEDFFQKVYRGSALEGLSHISPKDPAELAGYVEWLYLQKEPPAWGVDMAKAVEKRLFEFHSGGGRIAQLTEIQRAQMIDEVWTEFRSTHGLANEATFPPRRPSGLDAGRALGRNCIRRVLRDLHPPKL